MVDTVLLWIGVLVAVALACVAVAASRFVTYGERPLLPLAWAAVALAGVFELGGESGYFRPLRATAMTSLALLVALVLVVLWYRDR